MRRATALQIVAGGAVGVLTSACAHNPALAITPDTRSGKSLKIWSVHAEDAGDTVLVHGLVRRPALALGMLYGHLHVVARFSDGRPDVIADTRWSRIAPRGSRTGSYAVRLPIADAAAVSHITVSYAPTADAADTIPGMNP
ncbi:hypothetical protein ACFB49_28890 [Sphingomonas sp. DBB INV C78]|uniref:hypothetical protein n=1 Tax=Sphingomonas sp. DBB INV C78 TaxID=3349434 RepID=UPI0036D4339E